ncbi:MAG: SDR family oxidoreductase [Bacteroidota bacterium]
MIQEKIALITGGSRGLGRDMALNVARKGLHVVLTYHANKEAAEQVVSEIQNFGAQALALQLDTSAVSTFDSFFSALPQHLETAFGTSGIDYLVNNAGTGHHALIADTTEEGFDEMLNIHFKGVYFFTQKMLPMLNDGGGIVNISSGLARFSFPGFAAYASMKGAVEVFTRYLAKELGGRKINANVVAPGAVATDFAGGANRDGARKDIIAGVTAMGRVGEATDIGSIVAFLCTDEANWITAQRIEASGGTLI